MTLVYISFFGLCGILSRYLFNSIIHKLFHPTLPIATFAINILGSILIGLIYTYSYERNFISEQLRLGIMVGFLGGFTTFSTFSLEAVQMLERNEVAYALLYLTLTPLLGFLGALTGIVLMRRFL